MALFTWLLLPSLCLLNCVLGAIAQIEFDSYAIQLDYRPDSTNTTGGGPSWNSSFTGSPWSARRTNNTAPQQLGVGQGFHWVSNPALILTEPDARYPDVSVGTTFYGTGIDFYGHFGVLHEDGSVEQSPAGAAVSIHIEGPQGSDLKSFQPPQENGIIASYQGLPLDNYTATIRPETGVMSFTHYVVHMEVGGR
jgi:hypothetical protein